ncbi:ABC transporter ATP-binding protein [Aminipila terrae]|uniref:sn-glycerol-3-phosphate ABC transporter ATP-binding protein UgpC n=1 Tax=Aminipila terrae TaxID=2697030 RepID=A0A6P1MQT9_9FIRM|nr:sn-glycerol-3-phosphate ABC transporter ATP-binding protein UgpC [Aminipila terrae]QHI74026.1 sn-glycerol-3-phosphate ABC transporter ATP-binding protein UgpC [Aminipila terrae]
MAKIQIKNLKKIYPGNVTAVHDFNLEIEDKEFIVLVGPSGCGKSTMLRMIAGLEDISGGELYIGEKKVNHVVSKDRNIAMVFQNYALYPHMTVFKNMAFGLTLRKVPKEDIKQKVLDAAKILGIEQLLDRKPKALSGGQRQRVALGRAMVRNPEVFLLDEPLSNLDAKLRNQMRTEILNLHKRLGTTFVYVTHDQTEAMTMSDRMVVMKDGYIQQVGTPQNLYNKPCNMFVAGFIGTPQMNFFTGRIVKRNDIYAAEFEGHLIRLHNNKFEELALYEGREVMFGIRPEDFSIQKECSHSVKMKIELIEHMGSEMYLHCMLNGNKFIVRTPVLEECKAGSFVPLAFNGNRLHIFDKDTHMAI